MNICVYDERKLYINICICQTEKYEMYMWEKKRNVAKIVDGVADYIFLYNRFN